MKNKFCSNCQEGIDVPASRVRASLKPSLQLDELRNDHREGFWSQAPQSLGGGQIRVVNNTMMCTGPELILFKDEPPPLEWGPIPKEW